LILVLLAGGTVAPAHADKNASRAVELFRAGDGKFAKAEYSAARALYRQANGLYPDPSILYMVGRCHEVEREFADALAIYSKVLEMPNVPDKVRAKAEEGVAYLQRLNPKRYRLVVTANTQAQFTLDGTSKGEGEVLSVDVPGGEHVVRVTADGYEDVERTLSVVRDTDAVVHMAPDESDGRWTSWILLGVGGASLSAGGLLILDALGHADEASRATQSQLGRAAYDDAQARARTAEIYGVTATVVGAAALGFGVYLLLSEPTDMPSAQAGVSVQPNGVVWRW